MTRIRATLTDSSLFPLLSPLHRKCSGVVAGLGGQSEAAGKSQTAFICLHSSEGGRDGADHMVKPSF